MTPSAISDRFAAGGRGFGALPTAERASRYLTWALVTFGILLRLNGQVFHVISLWADETHWATQLLRAPLRGLAMRPLAYMALTKLLATSFGATELWLRSLSIASGIAIVLLAPYVSRRLFATPLARIVVVFSFALNPALIDFSKEFKPYSLEALLHLLPLVLYLRFRETQARRWLYAALALLPVTFLFAYNIVFAYPGVLLVWLWAAYREGGKKVAAWVVASGAVSLALSLSVYRLLLRRLGGTSSEAFWGNKYGVFYVTPDFTAGHEPSLLARASMRAGWLAERYLDLAALPGVRRQAWTASELFTESFLRGLGTVEASVWCVLHGLGLWWLVRQRRYDWLVLLALPALAAAVANQLAVWPFGAFRTNLFLCVPMILIAGFGVEAVGQGRRLRQYALASALVLLTVAPGFAFGFEFHRYKSFWTKNLDQLQIFEALESERRRQVEEESGPKRLGLVMDPGSWSAWRFYLRYQPQTRATYAGFMDSHLESKSSARLGDEIRKRLRAGEPLWIQASSSKFARSARAGFRRGGRVRFELQQRDDRWLWYVVPKRRRR